MHLPAFVALTIARVRAGVCECKWCSHTIAAERWVCRRECAARRSSACMTKQPSCHASTTLLPCNDARLLVGCVVKLSTHPCGSQIPHPNASVHSGLLPRPLPGHWSMCVCVPHLAHCPRAKGSHYFCVHLLLDLVSPLSGAVCLPA